MGLIACRLSACNVQAGAPLYAGGGIRFDFPGIGPEALSLPKLRATEAVGKHLSARRTQTGPLEFRPFGKSSPKDWEQREMLSSPW